MREREHGRTCGYTALVWYGGTSIMPLYQTQSDYPDNEPTNPSHTSTKQSVDK